MSLHWAALLTNATCDSSPRIDPQSVAVWALQFTPRVAQKEQTVWLEVAQSTRLFGGEDPLHQRVETGAAELGIRALAWAPTSLAALACARMGIRNGFAMPLAQVLDPLPIECMDAVKTHQATLARLGCQTLADVRQLPRGGISRRFDSQLLLALDQAYGLRPEGYAWVKLPEIFSAKLELPGRVDTAPALMFGARRLLLQMGGWLSARHCGVTAFTLHWGHDAMRARDAGEGGSITVRTAQPTQNVDHLCRLLGENLAKVQLLAPTGELALSATEVSPFIETSRSLLPDARASGEALNQVLERIEARLGQKRVLRPMLVEDTRMAWMAHWQPLNAQSPGIKVRQVPGPQPTWILKNPLKLDVRDDCPLYQGPLQLLLGPERIEGGWWHRVKAAEGGQHSLQVARDYWVALSQHAGALWIFQQRLPRNETACWYLHGIFA
ncbi:DNA polymerase Y family protein [Rhodoferax sp.]|uniref:Y-family DNA polymerase n=1 Tax=Rhodoferax sp. TaxID=50421 RepID=UPI00271D7B8E|nr:DNA polymerase Y family protein [Rhodoferax sp.]MDO9144092.1 DNA polymerase Y family protein [Rhodoferax sp.]MDP3864415.1 DNA polymerase Y family protein [Rhodoferax sp.]